MAKKLRRIRRIVGTESYRIHGIQFGPHPTFNKLNDLTRTPKPRLITILSIDWRTSKSDYFNEQMPFIGCSLNAIFVLAIKVELTIIHISLEYFTRGISSNVYQAFGHISHSRYTLVLNQCASQTRKVMEYTAWQTQAICGGIPSINFLLERRLCQAFVHATRLTLSIFQAFSILVHTISKIVIFEMKSAAHLQSTPGNSLSWFAVFCRVPKSMKRHGIPQLQLRCQHSGILTYQVQARNGTV